MKRTVKKLSLNTETLRSLDGLKDVFGGLTLTERTRACSDCDTCDTCQPRQC